MGNPSYRWLLLSLALFGFTVDQISKYAMFRWLYNDGLGDTREVIPGWFRFIAQFDPEAKPCDCGFSSVQTWSGDVLPRVNHGALFGMGGSQKGMANGFFLFVSIAASIAILVWGTRPSVARDRWLSAALGLILGGTLGNLYDRAVFNGVRDFLYFYRIEWPVFNFADCCLVVGAVMLLISAIVAPADTDSKAITPTPAATPNA